VLKLEVKSNVDMYNVELQVDCLHDHAAWAPPLLALRDVFCDIFDCEGGQSCVTDKCGLVEHLASCVGEGLHTRAV